jgi:hypothetical protein
MGSELRLDSEMSDKSTTFAIGPRLALNLLTYPTTRRIVIFERPLLL